MRRRQGAWEELIQRCEDVGVDAFEINFSCPHGMPERKMGMAMGQDCDLLGVRGRVMAGSLRPCAGTVLGLRFSHCEIWLLLLPSH